MMHPTSPRLPSAVDAKRAAPQQAARGEELPSGLLSGRSVRAAKRGRDDKNDDEGERTASIKRAPPNPLDLRGRAIETLAPYAGMPTRRVETKAAPHAPHAPHASHASHASHTPAVAGMARLPVELRAIIAAYASTDSRHPERIFNTLRGVPPETPLPPDIADFIQKQFPPEFHAMRQEWLDRLRSPATLVDDDTLKFIPLILRSDREIFLEAIRREGDALRYASDELRNDRDFCLQAVKQHLDAFQYVSTELRDDRELCMTAIEQATSNIRYASTRLRNDPLVYWPAVKAGANLRDLPPELLGDRELCLVSLKAGSDRNDVPDEIMNNLEFAKQLLLRGCFTLEDFPPQATQKPRVLPACPCKGLQRRPFRLPGIEQRPQFLVGSRGPVTPDLSPRTCQPAARSSIRDGCGQQ